MLLTALIVLLPLALAAIGPAQPAHRRHHARSPSGPESLVLRAGAIISNQTIAEMSAAAAAASASSAGSASSAASPSSAATGNVQASTQTTMATDSVTMTTTSAVSTSSAASTTNDAVTSSTAVSSAITSGASSSIASSTVISTSSTSATSVETSAVVTTTATSTTSSSASAVIASSSSSVVSVTEVAPSTVSLATSTPLSITTTITQSTIALVTTVSKTASTSSSASAASDLSSSSKSGLGKTTLIAIIIVASIVGLAAAGWTAFRKWKLKPSNRFDERMKPIDFSPHPDGLDADFLEKTLQRTTSNLSADRQRQQFVTELDDPHRVAGIPEHDFTAGAINGAGHGAYNQYNQEPYSHAEQYEYDSTYSQHAYPPSHEYPSSDAEINDGYADLQRGNSVGSGSGHGHAQTYPTHESFPSPENYLGRPTGGSDGPYAQAAQYRSH